MKYLEDLKSKHNSPRLIPIHKKVERRLLSVFMALLGISPIVRSTFLDMCGYRSGKTCSYAGWMEPEFRGSKLSDVRPDGLISCTRGKSSWAAFIEAKADKSEITTKQIQDYAELAKQLGVAAIVTISNEFARTPNELPYHLPEKSRKGAAVFHFAWADIRTMLELIHYHEILKETEAALIEQCLEFFWHQDSGILTFDAMPVMWPDFVEASSTALGFNQNIKGLTEVVYGWQQERRDLCAKLTHFTKGSVELRHKAGVRATEEDRTKRDKSDLASDYMLNARYYFPKTKVTVDVNSDLRACRTTVSMELIPPEDRGAKAISTWLSRNLAETDMDLQLMFDWPGRKNDLTLALDEFLEEPSLASDNRKSPPRKIHLAMDKHGVRRFKSRKLFIEDVEDTTFKIVHLGQSCGWIL